MNGVIRQPVRQRLVSIMPPPFFPVLMEAVSSLIIPDVSLSSYELQFFHEH
jgi:hypothetical protein